MEAERELWSGQQERIMGWGERWVRRQIQSLYEKAQMKPTASNAKKNNKNLIE